MPSPAAPPMALPPRSSPRPKRFHSGSSREAWASTVAPPKTSVTEQCTTRLSEPTGLGSGQQNQSFPYTVVKAISSSRPRSAGLVSAAPKLILASSISQ